MQPGKPLRVVHLPVNIGGMAWGLAQAQKTLGMHAEVVVLERNYLDYPVDRVIFPDQARARGNLRYPRLLREVMHLRSRFDVFHFDFGTSLIDRWKKGKPLLDLPWYKKKGKIAVTYNGCDARQQDLTVRRYPFSACPQESCYPAICGAELDELKRKRIERFDRYADVIFAVSPDLLPFLPARALHLPCAIPHWERIETLPFRLPARALRVVHAPTNRAAKGSDLIVRALTRLKAEVGDRLEFTLIENLPNHEALKLYAEADLIIDQILIGWYGAFAVEAMKMGKPVMAFLRDEDLGFVHPRMAAQCREAVLVADPADIEDRLRTVLDNPELLKRHRDAALDFVHAWHSPGFLGRVTREAYENS